MAKADAEELDKALEPERRYFRLAAVLSPCPNGEILYADDELHL